ncbi:MAG TPA: hypothetical protein VNR17_10200 [Luteimicrobium sp.]|nr:hypothetical protein [Luteimicrobium sp.]
MSSAVSDVIDELDLTELSGTRSVVDVGKKRSMSVEIQGRRFGDDPLRVVLRAVLSLENRKTADSEDEDRLLYTSHAEYSVRLLAGAEGVDNETLVELVWPYIRTVLLGHARVLGAPELKLPLGLAEADAPPPGDE